MKAAEAAIQAKEWGKAVQIVDVIQDLKTSGDFYGRIAAHYATTDELDVSFSLPQSQSPLLSDRIISRASDPVEHSPYKFSVDDVLAALLCFSM